MREHAQDTGLRPLPRLKLAPIHVFIWRNICAFFAQQMIEEFPHIHIVFCRKPIIFFADKPGHRGKIELNLVPKLHPKLGLVGTGFTRSGNSGLFPALPLVVVVMPGRGLFGRFSFWFVSRFQFTLRHIILKSIVQELVCLKVRFILFNKIL